MYVTHPVDINDTVIWLCLVIISSDLVLTYFEGFFFVFFVLHDKGDKNAATKA